MTAQDLALYAIIKKQITELLKPELVRYFDGNSRKVLEAAFMSTLRKVTPTPDVIKNYISQDSELKPPQKKAVFDYLESILQKPKYIDVIGIEEQLEVEYYDRQFSRLSKLQSEDITLEMKKSIVSEVSETINKTRPQDDFKNIQKVLTEFRDNYNVGAAADFQAKLIKIKCPHLIRLFDDTIYPHMYSVLARPGDFKTSLLINLLIEFDTLKIPGIFYTIEDSATMAAIKAIGAKAGISKKKLFQHTYNAGEIDKLIETFGKNIYVMDKMRTADEIYRDLHNKLSAYNYRWIAVDYLQLIKREKYMSDYDRINLFDSLLFELNKEFQIPVFRLTQAPKDKIQSGGVLGMGDEKGSGEISQNTRFALSINQPSGDEGDGTVCNRIIQRYKTTFCKKGQFAVEFEGSTGKLLNVQELT